MKKVYYAHSQALYNTPQEERDVDLLETLGFEVVNPNSPEIQKLYQEWRDSLHSISMGKMHIFKKVIDGCDALAFRAHPSGGIPAGVAKEIEMAQGQYMDGGISIPVFELPRMLGERVLSVEATRAWLQEIGQR